MVMSDFYECAYSETPAHTDDIHDMIIENPELEVITEAGGSRRYRISQRALAGLERRCSRRGRLGPEETFQHGFRLPPGAGM